MQNLCKMRKVKNVVTYPYPNNNQLQKQGVKKMNEIASTDNNG